MEPCVTALQLAQNRHQLLALFAKTSPYFRRATFRLRADV
jgi:hypothetical protein